MSSSQTHFAPSRDGQTVYVLDYDKNMASLFGLPLTQKRQYNSMIKRLQSNPSLYDKEARVWRVAFMNGSNRVGGHHGLSSKYNRIMRQNGSNFELLAMLEQQGACVIRSDMEYFLQKESLLVPVSLWPKSSVYQGMTGTQALWPALQSNADKNMLITLSLWAAFAFFYDEQTHIAQPLQIVFCDDRSIILDHAAAFFQSSEALLPPNVSITFQQWDRCRVQRSWPEIKASEKNMSGGIRYVASQTKRVIEAVSAYYLDRLDAAGFKFRPSIRQWLEELVGRADMITVRSTLMELGKAS